MALLNDIVTFLVNKGLVVGAGTDTFLDFKPETPDNIVSIHEYNGSGISTYIEVVQRSIQIVVRNKSAVQARSLANSICKAFRDEMGTDHKMYLTPTHWCQVYIRQVPQKFSQDENDRWLYGFNIGITTTLD